MDLTLPRFEGLGEGPRQVHRPWMVSTESPASPVPGCFTDLQRSPSLFPKPGRLIGRFPMPCGRRGCRLRAG